MQVNANQWLPLAQLHLHTHHYPQPPDSLRSHTATSTGGALDAALTPTSAYRARPRSADTANTIRGCIRSIVLTLWMSGLRSFMRAGSRSGSGWSGMTAWNCSFKSGGMKRCTAQPSMSLQQQMRGATLVTRLNHSTTQRSRQCLLMQGDA
jgi:hypothetical protein